MSVNCSELRRSSVAPGQLLTSQSAQLLAWPTQPMPITFETEYMSYFRVLLPTIQILWVPTHAKGVDSGESAEATAADAAKACS